MALKTVSMPEKQRKGIAGLHIEIPGCIVNIRPYLNTFEGKPVTSIEFQKREFFLIYRTRKP